MVISYTSETPCPCCGSGKLVQYDGTVISIDTGWIDIAIGTPGIADTFWAIKSDGTLWFVGQTPYTSVIVTELTQFGTDTDWAAVDGLEDRLAAIKSDGTLWAIAGEKSTMGFSDSGSLTAVTQIGTLSNWAYVKITLFGIVAINSSGGMYAAGDGNGGIPSGTFELTAVGGTNWHSVTRFSGVEDPLNPGNITSGYHALNDSGSIYEVAPGGSPVSVSGAATYTSIATDDSNSTGGGVIAVTPSGGLAAIKFIAFSGYSFTVPDSGSDWVFVTDAAAVNDAGFAFYGVGLTAISDASGSAIGGFTLYESLANLGGIGFGVAP